jgi:hypothetical protein
MLANSDKNAILTAYENSGTDFQPMKLGHRSRTPKTEAYLYWLDDVKAKPCFEAMAQSTQEYVGEMVGIQSLPQRIRAIS